MSEAQHTKEELNELVEDLIEDKKEVTSEKGEDVNLNELSEELEDNSEIHEESESIKDSLGKDAQEELVPEENDEQLEEETVEESEKPSKKKTKIWKILGIFGGSVLGLAIVLYLAGVFYFSNHFDYMTYVAGVECSGKTAQEVTRYLNEKSNTYELTIVSRTGEVVISGKDIGMSYKLDNILDQAISKQNPFLWGMKFIEIDKNEIELDLKCDEEKFNSSILALDFMKEENQQKPVAASVVYEENEFVVKKEELGTTIDKDMLFSSLDGVIRELGNVINLEETGCYIEPKYTSSSKEIMEAVELANKCLGAKITHQVNDKVQVLDGAEIATWISFDEKMELIISSEQIEAYVGELSNKYNTIGAVRTIVTPTGKEAQVSGGTYGRKVDESEEAKTLKADILEGKELTRAPKFSQNASSTGKYDWGNTYLEVDITEQHMWYIEKGEVVFEADVVTGSPGRSTPQGVYTILEKMRNKTLRGNIMPNGKREYETPVDYWMRVTWSGIGFHDATWQAEFGGTRYRQGYGSHGCINMSLSDVKKLYGMVDKGCPVIIHY